MNEGASFKLYCNVSSLAEYCPDDCQLVDAFESAELYILQSMDEAESEHLKANLQKPVIVFSSKERLAALLSVAYLQIERQKELPAAALEKARKDPWLRLLLFIYLSNTPLRPHYDSRLERGMGYPLPVMINGIDESLAELTRLGFLKAEFFDCGYQCPSCESLSLMMRDACPNCQGVHLSEQPIIHHFPCSYQATEDNFLQSVGVYTCPKCHKVLKQIGLDYDKPGSETTCLHCQHDATNSLILARCLSCLNEFKVDDTQKKTLHQYQLTDMALSALVDGAIRPVTVADFLKESQAIENTETFFSLLKKMQALNQRKLLSSMILSIKLTSLNDKLASDEKIPFYRTISKEIIESLRETDSLWFEKDTIYLLLCHCKPSSMANIKKRLTQVFKDTTSINFEPSDLFIESSIDSFKLG